tara:strand:- start:630 stop:1076 length:447 start_codon:yes stop_codon:yes gene_type:complete
MKELYKREPMHTQPKDCTDLFWDHQVVGDTPSQDDLYVGKGATYTPWQCDYPYTIVEITGKLGNRIAKLNGCGMNSDGDFYDYPIPMLHEWDLEDGYIYIKEKDLDRKMNKYISYSKVYTKSLKTNRLRITSGSVSVGERMHDVPLEI